MRYFESSYMSSSICHYKTLNKHLILNNETLPFISENSDEKQGDDDKKTDKDGSAFKG